MKILSLLALLCLTSLCSAEPVIAPLYAFANGLPGGTAEQQAQTLKELGYAGVNGLKSVTDADVAAYQKHGIKVLSVYLNVNDKPLHENQIKALANKGAMLELTVLKMTPGSVEAVRSTVEMADKLGIKVALYPHYGNGIATVADALDMIKKVNHPNLGMMFNLCHFLRGEKIDSLEATLAKAAPHLLSVSTSGAQIGGTNWNTLIQTLDHGNFPQQRLIRALEKINYTGPMTLQCYSIKGDKRSNLAKSMAAWKKLDWKSSQN